MINAYFDLISGASGDLILGVLVDLNPEFNPLNMGNLFLADVLDVYFTPIQMKKNRPGTQLSVLCREKDLANTRNILFAKTSTLGIREANVKRHNLNRQIELVETPWGNLKRKNRRIIQRQGKFLLRLRGMQKNSPPRRCCVERSVQFRNQIGSS